MGNHQQLNDRSEIHLIRHTAFWADGWLRTMEPSTPRRRADSLLEYTLYAAILLMTVCGAYLYRSIAQDPILTAFNRYLIFAYLVFLGASFGQLNALHRKRRGETSRRKPSLSFLGLTLAQIVLVAFVFVTACVTFTWALSILR